MSAEELVDHFVISISAKELGMMLVSKLDKNPDQQWQFRVWQDEADPRYLYVLGRVPPASWAEGS